jgi:hypothetical protein
LRLDYLEGRGFYSPVIGPSLNAMKFLLNDARSFLGASVQIAVSSANILVFVRKVPEIG